MKSEIGLHDRTKKFHIAVIKLCETLPRNAASFEIAKQLIRSAGSVGANCRAMARAKSTKDFINKTAIVIEEADESHYWLEVLKEVLPINNNDILDKLINEANELSAIFVSISKKSKY